MVRRLLLIAVLLIVPATSYAQDATLSGTVKDTSGGVLPGVTVTALHEATGNTFVAVTDGVGAFRLPVRTGSYRITVELAGFATVVRSVKFSPERSVLASRTNGRSGGAPRRVGWSGASAAASRCRFSGARE